jgi:DnaJ-class molecular chaperone
MKVECPCCDGAGEKYDSRKTYRTSLQPYYTKCPLCLGKGEVCEEDAEDFDEDKTLADYEEDRAADAWEAREEARREAKWDR